MFIFTKSVKEVFVTVGVAMSCGLFVAASILWIHDGQWNLILALLALLLVAAVLRGIKLGYLITRYVWRGVAFLSVLGGAINPFAYLDVHAARGSFPYFIAVCLLVSILAFCLSEQAKLRKLEGAEKWRSFP